MTRATRRSPRRDARPRRRTRWRLPSRGPRPAARRRRASGERRGVLLELTGVIEVVQAQEEQGLPPVERAEHAVLDPLVETSGGVGPLHALEEPLAIALEDGAPLRGR